MYRFDLNVSGNTVASSNAAVFQIGFGFSPTVVGLETDVNTHSRIGINWTSTPGQYSIRNSNNSASSVNFTGTQTVTWVINNSDAALSYMGPNGIVQTLGNDRDDVWIGSTLVFDEMLSVTAIRWLRNLKFTFLSGSATIELDNILVDPIPVVTSAPAQTFCASNNPTLANLVGNGTNLKWYSALSGGSALAPTTALTTGTYFVSQSPNGFESLRTPVSINVISSTVNNTIGNTQTICSGNTPLPLTGSVPTGGTGVYTYLWESASSSAGPFTSTLVVSPNFSPPVLTSNTWYRRQVFSGICSSISNSVAITVDRPIINNDISSSQTICFGTTPATFISGPSLSGGNGIGYSYVWESASAISGPYSAAIGTNNTGNYSSGTLNANTWFRRQVSSGVCPAVYSDTIRITVDPLIANNTISAAQTICTGTAPATLTGSVPTGGSGTFTYTWESSTTNASSGFSPISLATSIGYTAPILSTNTWFRRKVVSGTCSSNSAATGITVQALPTVSAGSDIGSISQGGTSAALGGSFGGSATGAVWSATSGTFSNNSGTTPAATTFTSSSTSPTSVTLTIKSTGGVCPVVSGSKTISVTPGTPPTNNDLTGVINKYAQVVGPGTIPVGSINCTLATGESSQFARGDRAMIIQMKGASVSLPTSPTDITYGYITEMGNSGNHEFLYIDSVKGDRIRFRKSLLKAYNTSGLVQLIRIPQYTGNYTVRNSTSISTIKLIRKGMGYAPNSIIATGFTIAPTNGGSGLQLRALTDNLGQISEVQIINPGTGYLRAPTITLPNPTVAPFNLPNYKAKAVAITGLTGMQWNGKKGGVLVFEINGNLILQDSIKMSGMGFAGGMIGDKGSATANCGSTSDYGLNWTNISRAGQKGEGIAIIPDLVQRGRGRYATGGGGGMEPEGGGAGGANWQDGGRGGNSSYILVANSKCSTTVTGCDNQITRGGLGGGTNPTIPVGNKNVLRANSYYHTPIAYTRIFLGGGGGGGHALNATTGMQSGGAGGYGGGIVIMKANDLKSNNFKILANGENGENASGDGAGGGGSGGALLLNVNTFSDLLRGRVNGGNGGYAISTVCDAGFGSYSDKYRYFGAGGGGGGGVVWLPQSDLDVTPLAEGCNLGQSNNGKNDDPVNNSSQKGGTSRSQSLLIFVENSPIAAAVLTVGSGISRPGFPNLKAAADWISLVGTTQKDITILMGRNNISTGSESNQVVFNSGSSTSGSALKTISIKPYFDGETVLMQNEGEKNASLTVNGLESLSLDKLNLHDSKDLNKNEIVVQNGSKLILNSVKGKANISVNEPGANAILTDNLILEGNLNIGNAQKISIQNGLTLLGSNSENAKISLGNGTEFLMKENANLKLENADWINNGAKHLNFEAKSLVQFSGTNAQQKIGGSSDSKFENVAINSTGRIVIEKNIQAKSWNQVSDAVVDHGQNTVSISKMVKTGSGKFTGKNGGKILIGNSEGPVEIAGQFYGLEMNNSQNAFASGPIQIDQKLVLNEGRIDLNTHEMKVMPNESDAIAFTPNSWVNGKIRQNVITGKSYQFPVGSETNQEMAVLQIQKIENGLQNIQVSYQDECSNAVKEKGLEKIQNQGKWEIQPNQGNAKFDLSLMPSQMYFPGEAQILGKSGKQDNWNVLPSNSKSNNLDGQVKQSEIQSFGEFSIGRKANIGSNQSQESNGYIPSKPTLCLVKNEGKKFEILGGSNEITSFRIIGNDGKSFTKSNSIGSRILDLNTSPTGIYLVEMINENGETIRQRIVLKN
jgi:hypothetical protein